MCVCFKLHVTISAINYPCQKVKTERFIPPFKRTAHLSFKWGRLKTTGVKTTDIKAGLYRIWCGVNTLGDSGANTLGDTSAFVNPTVQLFLTRRGKTRMDGVGIVFELYIAHL